MIDKLKYCSLAELNYLARKSKIRKLAILELRNRVLSKELSWFDERGMQG